MVRRFIISVSSLRLLIAGFLKRILKAFRSPLVLLLSTIFALLIAEGIVRFRSYDLRFIGKLLYYQTNDVNSHEPDPDPEILFRLKPGSHQYTDHRVFINSLRARSPERPAKKPPGVFRIVCLGGSNVYGTTVNDEETWPARLEENLNREAPGRFEVWNYGTSAYVAVQMAAVGKDAVNRLDPDLVIFAPSNTGRRAFLGWHPVDSYLGRNSPLWEIVFTPRCLPQPSFLSYENRLKLIRSSSLYRLAAAYWRPFHGCVWDEVKHESLNEKAARDFFAWVTERGVKICVFILPDEPKDFGSYYSGLTVPVLRLFAEDMPAEYSLPHPPPHVLAWYGEQIAVWLHENRLVPE